MFNHSLKDIFRDDRFYNKLFSLHHTDVERNDQITSKNIVQITGISNKLATVSIICEHKKIIKYLGDILHIFKFIYYTIKSNIGC